MKCGITYEVEFVTLMHFVRQRVCKQYHIEFRTAGSFAFIRNRLNRVIHKGTVVLARCRHKPFQKAFFSVQFHENGRSFGNCRKICGAVSV